MRVKSLRLRWNCFVPPDLSTHLRLGDGGKRSLLELCQMACHYEAWILCPPASRTLFRVAAGLTA